MAKQRKSKRQLVRDERRKKKRELEHQDEDVRDAKRQRVHKDAAGVVTGANSLYYEDDGGNAAYAYGADAGAGGPRPDTDEYIGSGAPREFFGLLGDPEQEYFRRADELLELNEFATPEELHVFLANVFREARGKELKIASSQSCSRLMERLIQLASTRQKKHLFRAFSTHIVTLVTHRFASHCCEQLFLQSAAAVGQDDTTDEEDIFHNNDGADAEQTDEQTDEQDNVSMEQHFLLVLDELEPNISALLTDRFASHTLRVLLMVLSGRPFDGAAARSLLRSRKKEVVTVAGKEARSRGTGDGRSDTRSVPPSFSTAVHKILADVAASLDPASLRILATHPTGNPVLQLLVELEMGESKKAKAEEAKNGKAENTILGRLLPGAPATLSDPQSPAAELVRTLVYDRVGSRLLETLVTNGPARLFKALYASTFAARAPEEQGGEQKDASASTSFAHPMAVYLRNDVACYPAMRVLERLGRDELAAVVEQQILAVPTAAALSGRTAAPASVVAQLVERQRFSVLKTLFVRCEARGVDAAVSRHLTDALRQAVGADRHGDIDKLVARLCLVKDAGTTEGTEGETSEAAGGPPGQDVRDEKKETAAAAHGCQLVSAMLAIPGLPSQVVQKSLLALSGDQLAAMATSSTASAAVVIAAITNSGNSSNEKKPSVGQMHNRPVVPLAKQLVSRLVPFHMRLATSPAGHAVLVAIVQRPSRVGENGAEASSASAVHVDLPFHLKESFVSQLATHEEELRGCWPGRVVWRAWRIDLWRSRRAEWVRWSKAGEPEGLQKATTPTVVMSRGGDWRKDEQKNGWRDKEAAAGKPEQPEQPIASNGAKVVEAVEAVETEADAEETSKEQEKREKKERKGKKDKKDKKDKDKTKQEKRKRKKEKEQAKEKAIEAEKA